MTGWKGRRWCRTLGWTKWSLVFLLWQRSKPWKWGNRRFLKLEVSQQHFIVRTNHLGILLKGWPDLVGLGWAWDTAFLTSSWVMQLLLTYGPHTLWVSRPVRTSPPASCPVRDSSAQTPKQWRISGGRGMMTQKLLEKQGLSSWN